MRILASARRRRQILFIAAVLLVAGLLVLPLYATRPATPGDPLEQLSLD